LEYEVLAFCIAHDALAITTELRIVRREQHQPGERTLSEALDEDPIPELRLDLPVGRDGPEVDDTDVPAWRLCRRLGGGLGHRHVQ
jgi:hypothetical protein